MPDGSQPVTEKDTVADVGIRADRICSLRDGVSLKGGLLLLLLLLMLVVLPGDGRRGGGVDVCDEGCLSGVNVDCPSTAALAVAAAEEEAFLDLVFFVFFVLVDFDLRCFAGFPPMGNDSDDAYVVGSFWYESAS